MDVKLSIADETLERAREVASRRGMTVDQLILEYLEELASNVAPEGLLAELTELWATSGGDSAGRAWTREELHERSGIR